MKKYAAAIPDALVVAGSVAISYGAGLLHPAAGAIVAGVLMIAAGFLSAMNARKAAE